MDNYRVYTTGGRTSRSYGMISRVATTKILNVTREPRARDSEAKGPREYWWEAPSLGSTDGKHRASGVSVATREASAGIPELRGTPESRDYSEC